MQSDAGWRRRQGGKMFSSHCHHCWHWRRPNPVEHGSRWAANVRQPAAESSQTRAKCASPWQTTITYKLTLLCVIKYNKRGHLLNALAHISVGFREHCVAACWSGCLGTICQPDGNKIQLQKYIYFFFQMPHDCLFCHNIVYKYILVWESLTASPLGGKKYKEMERGLIQFNLSRAAGNPVRFGWAANVKSPQGWSNFIKHERHQMQRWWITTSHGTECGTFRNLGLASGCSLAKELQVAQLNCLLFNFWQQLVKLSLLLKTQPLIVTV